jgi:hypothetical protein
METNKTNSEKPEDVSNTTMHLTLGDGMECNQTHIYTIKILKMNCQSTIILDEHGLK